MSVINQGLLSGAAKQNRDIALCITVHVYLIHATGSGIRAYARLRFAKSVAREKWLRAQEKATSQKLKPPLKPPVKVLAHQAPYPHYRSKPNRTSSSGRRRDEKMRAA